MDILDGDGETLIHVVVKHLVTGETKEVSIEGEEEMDPLSNKELDVKVQVYSRFCPNWTIISLTCYTDDSPVRTES